MPTDYTLMDATAEILLMLLAAFLLGWLFCWLMKKLFGIKEAEPAGHHYSADRPDAGISTASADLGAARLREHKMDRPDIPKASMNVDADLPAEDIDVSTSDVNIDAQTGARPKIDLPDLKAPDVDIASIGSRGKESIGKGLGAAAAGVGAVAAGAAALKDDASDSLSALTPDNDLTQPDLPEEIRPGQPVAAVTEGTDGLVQDDLTRISGIDNSVADILRNKGVHSYATLQQVDRATLKGYLDSSGDPSMRLIEPASWPHQARLCAERNWSKLADYQSFLSGNQLDPVAPALDTGTQAQQQDDLKKIEGIGPIFEGLLNEAGIHTFQQLSESSRDSLKAIIDAGGSEYRMHEPETWPYQARLASQGDWQKLNEYIQFMTGRN